MDLFFFSYHSFAEICDLCFHCCRCRLQQKTLPGRQFFKTRFLCPVSHRWTVHRFYRPVWAVGDFYVCVCVCVRSWIICITLLNELQNFLHNGAHVDILLDALCQRGKYEKKGICCNSGKDQMSSKGNHSFNSVYMKLQYDLFIYMF